MIQMNGRMGTKLDERAEGARSAKGTRRSEKGTEAVSADPWRALSFIN